MCLSICTLQHLDKLLIQCHHYGSPLCLSTNTFIHALLEDKRYIHKYNHKKLENRNNNLFTYLQQAYKKYVKFQEKISRFSGYVIIL